MLYAPGLANSDGLGFGARPDLPRSDGPEEMLTLQRRRLCLAGRTQAITVAWYGLHFLPGHKGVLRVIDPPLSARRPISGESLKWTPIHWNIPSGVMHVIDLHWW
jgi:hypothetical protein